MGLLRPYYKGDKMKALLLILALGLTTDLWADSEVPTLHRIKTIRLEKPYSCGGSYESSALFLSDYSKKRNSPELLYNGACGGPNFVDASTAGDDFALIADLGEVPIQAVSANRAINFERVVGKENLFKDKQITKKNHTYAVLISKSEIRALYVFKILSQEQDGAMIIEYAVKSYSIQKSIVESSGFDWETGNH